MINWGRPLTRGGVPDSANVTRRSFLDGLEPFFYTQRYIRRNRSGQEFNTSRYETFFGYSPGHMAMLVSTKDSSWALVAPLPAWTDMPCRIAPR